LRQNSRKMFQSLTGFNKGQRFGDTRSFKKMLWKQSLQVQFTHGFQIPHRFNSHKTEVLIHTVVKSRENAFVEVGLFQSLTGSIHTWVLGKIPIIYNPARWGFQLFPLFEFFIWISYNSKDAPVAQLDRAWASGARGCGFKSRQARKKPA
jgi:hypothetical protein